MRSSRSSSPAADQAVVWTEAMSVAERLSELFHPVKMNEIHSNTLAHLHMHLIPRRIDDPFVAMLEAGEHGQAPGCRRIAGTRSTSMPSLEVPVVGERQAGAMSAPFTTSYGGHVPIEDVAARDLGAGDVVRLDDPQAHRVERVVRLDARVVLELRPVGLSVSDTVRITVPEDTLVCRLGTTTE